MPQSSVTPFRFVVIADSHIRPADDDVATYPSDTLMVDRARFVVDLCNRIEAEFVVHLGDIVHPLPAETAHEPTLGLAAEVFEALRHPIHFVAGNHDVGDKPNALVAVPPVAEANYGLFEERWGPSYRSFDTGGCHFVILDTPILNSGLERERAQRVWLEDDLAQASSAGMRIFVFSHYPPFVYRFDEDEHYDNLGEPARSWLLDLVERHRVEAVFSGHVHNFLYNAHAGADLYVAPATGFVRPDYSELDAVPPEREGGRDEVTKLGVLVVDVTEAGHVVRPVRTHGATGSGSRVATPTGADSAWESPVGVTVRHGWMSVVDFPTEGLDEFRRKTVRNDAWLFAAWEARISRVRIPVGDLRIADASQRLGALGRRGMRFTVRIGGVPTPGQLERLAVLGSVVDKWEVVVPEASFLEAAAVMAEIPLPDGVSVAVAPLVPVDTGPKGVHHFVTAGFEPAGGRLLERLVDADPAGIFSHVVFGASASPMSAIAAASEAAAAHGRRAVVDVALPRAGESEVFDDDDLVAGRVGEAVVAAIAHPEVEVFLDGFVDHDRGYYRRHGLIDRRHGPRPALYRLITEAVARHAVD